jgi:hypothetical protein
MILKNNQRTNGSLIYGYMSQTLKIQNNHQLAIGSFEVSGTSDFMIMIVSQKN